MAVLTQSSGSGGFNPFDLGENDPRVPTDGIFPAVCVDLKEGKHEQQKYGEPGVMETFDAIWLLFEVQADGVVAKYQTRPIKLSAHEKSNLSKMLSGWFKDEYKLPFDTEKCRGKAVTIVFETNDRGYVEATKYLPPQAGGAPAAAASAAPPPAAGGDDGVPF
jgi:hypothetical protein